MQTGPDAFDLAELSERADVSVRTIRYYIQQGLLPSPDTRGPGARYGAEHLDRLRLIRKLQREHLPLAEIRKRLESLGAGGIERAAAELEETPRSSARDYIREVLSEGPAIMQAPAELSGSPPEPMKRARAAGPASWFARTFGATPAAESAARPHVQADAEPTPASAPAAATREEEAAKRAARITRSQWDRITLAPDVELHVRRPLSREQNRQVERLLDAARTIFEEDVP